MSGLNHYWKESPAMIALLIIVLVAITYAALGSVIVMVDRWYTSEEYGYAYMIPFLTGYLIWQNRVRLQQVEYKLSWAGGLLLFVGALTIMLGVLSATHSITQYGYIISLISAFYLFMGWKAFRIIAMPLLLLFLIVPLPTFIYNNLSSDLQLISSQIGVWVIREFGVSVYLEGNVIDLGTFKLQVVEACSGLRYLFPLFSLSVIAAYIYKAALWKRAIVVLSSIPITVFMNSFRIGVIGILVNYGGIEQAKGFLHEFEGWFVFMACLGLLFLEMWLLVSFGKNKKKLSAVFAIEAPAPLPTDALFETRSVSWPYFITVICVLVAGIIIGSLNERKEIIPNRTDFSEYPMQLGQWSGIRGSIEQQYLDVLKLDDYIIADYSNKNGDNVNLYMAYYKSQRSGAAAHSPRSCIPGGGWQIREHEVVDIKPIQIDGKTLTVNRMLIQKGDSGQLVYYWFEERGRDITNEYMVKWYLFWDSLTMNRTDGSLIRLTTPVSRGEDIHLADNRLVNFLKQTAPLVSKYISK